MQLKINESRMDFNSFPGFHHTFWNLQTLEAMEIADTKFLNYDRFRKTLCTPQQCVRFLNFNGISCEESLIMLEYVNHFYEYIYLQGVTFEDNQEIVEHNLCFVQSSTSYIDENICVKEILLRTSSWRDIRRVCDLSKL